jgi:hypothetical protein
LRQCYRRRGLSGIANSVGSARIGCGDSYFPGGQFDAIHPDLHGDRHRRALITEQAFADRAASDRDGAIEPSSLIKA